MRVLILTEHFAPAWAFGGPPKVLFGISKELVRRGHEVTVLTTNILDSKSVIEKRFDVLQGVEVHYLSILSKWLGWRIKVFLPIGYRTLLEGKIKNSDLVILACFRNLFNATGFYYARKYEIPYIVLPYGAIPRGMGIKKLIKWLFDSLLGYKILRNASGVFAQTEHEMQECKKFGARESCVKLVPLNIDLSEFRNLPPRGAFRKKFGVKENEKLVLFLGRLHKYKGLDLLIQAFSDVIRIRNGCRLAVVGRDDGYLSSMYKLIDSFALRGSVIFAGPLYGKDRLEAYIDADVFVMPSSNFEETSTAALEACAAFTPVIVTKQTSIPGLDKYQAGFIINYDRVQLVNALLAILDDENLMEKMSGNARRLVEETFDLGKVVDRFEDFFLSID
jgi:glycosyltransferase involved in cell wall biosynthesis